MNLLERQATELHQALTDDGFTVTLEECRILLVADKLEKLKVKTSV